MESCYQDNNSIELTLKSHNRNPPEHLSINLLSMETKTPPPTPTPSICAHGISQTFSCNFAASQTTLKALFMSSVRGSLDPSNRSIDPDESPAVIVVRIAFHLVYKAFLTGDKSDIQPALTGLDSAQTLIDQQRSKYLNLIEYDTWFFR